MDKMMLTKYIESKRNSWSPKTQQSEHARLRNIVAELHKGPEALYPSLVASGLSPYSIKTLFIRIGEFEVFATGQSTYKQFMKANANLFKNAYVKKEVPTSFEEASSRISSLPPSPEKQIAEALLSSGLRVSEALSYDGSGFVTGKGARKRRVFNLASGLPSTTYSKVYKVLKSVGLTPHQLRKLAATRLVEAGLKEADLMKVMGWTNMQTASIYIQPSKDQALEALVKEVLR